MLKLDLHTHIYEATGNKEPTPDIVLNIVDLARRAGLDGMAITEHNNPDYSFRFQEIASETLGDDTFVIIPGQEKDEYNKNRQVVELYLPGDATFRFLAHPGNPEGNLESDLSDLHGIEIRNSVHDWHIEAEEVRLIAQKWNLITISVSDAHYLHQIGKDYTLITLDDLYNRAMLKEERLMRQSGD